MYVLLVAPSLASAPFSLRAPLIDVFHYSFTIDSHFLLNQIAESFRRFGIAPATTSLIVIKVSTPSSPLTASEIQAHLDTSIEGEAIPLSDEALSGMTDVARVKKIYKLNSGGNAGGKKRAVNGDLGVAGEKEGDERKELEVAILGAMALRGMTN
ncbi:uncharacterized protein BP5553_08409 [Venustampulla echinocandica]|uniref:EKC/KEOPS complex subunit CGI121 n=1 Tax=Venustampulla echinocandica TaxID=2656787 RepID=A0A370TE89_9HELO|nr:uncharacterized protein BP5553_08409 [Venustampulla echinocandica]RDL32970.1 hypothetical protein BP5553_08409 [Venustampulla echinocandica]